MNIIIYKHKDIPYNPEESIVMFSNWAFKNTDLKPQFTIIKDFEGDARTETNPEKYQIAFFIGRDYTGTEYDPIHNEDYSKVCSMSYIGMDKHIYPALVTEFVNALITRIRWNGGAVGQYPNYNDDPENPEAQLKVLKGFTEAQWEMINK